MAINRVLINGYILQNPRVIRNKRTNIITATFTVRTTHRTLPGSKASNFEDLVVSVDDNDELVNYILTLRQFDVVEVKGALTLRKRLVKAQCTECGATHLESAVVSYIYPISINKRESLTPMYEARYTLPDRYLVDHFLETSNELFAGGVLSKAPVNISRTDKPVASYPVSIRRTKKIGTQPDTKFDTPWITTYGTQAETDLERLFEGACVDITGYISSTQTTKVVACECGNYYSYSLPKMVIVPYEVEYRFGKQKKDDTASLEKELNQMSDAEYIAYMMSQGRHL